MARNNWKTEPSSCRSCCATQVNKRCGYRLTSCPNCPGLTVCKSPDDRRTLPCFVAPSNTHLAGCDLALLLSRVNHAVANPAQAKAIQHTQRCYVNTYRYMQHMVHSCHAAIQLHSQHPGPGTTRGAGKYACLLYTAVPFQVLHACCLTLTGSSSEHCTPACTARLACPGCRSVSTVCTPQTSGHDCMSSTHPMDKCKCAMVSPVLH